MMQDPFAHCERVVRGGDPDRFFSALFAPAAARRGLFALYAFNLEVARVREHIREPMAGEIRLQWWREALQGSGRGEVSANPVAAALLTTIERHALAREKLIDLVEARSFDLYNDAMPSLDHLDAYARASASIVFDVGAAILSGNDGAAVAMATPAGIAYAVTGLLRAFALHASRGQVFVPDDILTKHGARHDDIVAGRHSPALENALRDLRAHARRHLDIAREFLFALRDASKPAFLPLALVKLYLAQMEARDYDPFRTAIDLPQWRKQWLLWRAARTDRVAG